MLEGFAAAYPDIVRLTESGLIVRRTPKPEGKVDAGHRQRQRSRTRHDRAGGAGFV